MFKKVLWILLLVALLIIMIVGISSARKGEDKTALAASNTSFGKTETSNTAVTIRTDTATPAKEENSKYVKTQLSDGVLYSVDGKEYKPDFVIDEKYFDTTINDIWLNPKTYKGKKIEIEGMYLENKPYTFVGRYATSSVCPNCPPGYSYFEYQFDGTTDEKLVDEKVWIKVIGTLEVGNDASTNYTDFYYLNVLSLEVMNEMGNLTVNN